MDGLTAYAVFNITTSSFNFIFNGLDLLMPLEEDFTLVTEHGEEVSLLHRRVPWREEFEDFSM